MGLAASIGATAPAAGANADYPVQPVPFTAIRFEDSFWRPRLETNRTVTVRYDFAKCEETGRLDNFAKAAGRMQGPFRGIPFDDSDVYKVIEGAAYTLATHPDAELEAYLDRLIETIAAAQEADGYLYTARRLFAPEAMPDMSGKERWSNLAASHELYNVGHLYEAAVAYAQATGKRTLLEVALRSADLVCRTFGPGPEQRQDPPGHQEIEIGLVKLFRLTGNRLYLDTARFFLDTRGRPEGHALRGPGQQDHLPVVEQREAVGHAVRAGYMYSAMADIAAITGDRAYGDAVDALWRDVVEHKLYLTGSIGASHGGEAFGAAYELPNASAYNETCAAIANSLWNHRMFLLHGDARYLDVLEVILYNGFLSGVSLSGDRFFYPNPLEADGHTRFNHGSAERQPWFGCSCCPVNVVRFLPSIPGFAYAVGGNSLYVNLYVAGSGETTVAGHKVRVTQETAYPWDGTVRLRLEPEAPTRFALRLRQPGWSVGRIVPSQLYRQEPGLGEEGSFDADPHLQVNGTPLAAMALQREKGFIVIERDWASGDVVELDFPMPVVRVFSHEAVVGNRGRVALHRGPVVYCLEGPDHEGHVFNLALPDGPGFGHSMHPDLLGGVVVLSAGGLAAREADSGAPQTSLVGLMAIPYAVWNHRGPGEMAVWLPRDPAHCRPLPRPTLAGASTPSASHTWQQDRVTALNDRSEPRSSGDHSIPRFTWWDHRGTEEWVQYDLPAPTRVGAVAIYWFDDSGQGQCRVPASWRLLARLHDQWQPVAATDPFGVAKDTWNRLRFAPVTATALRIEAQLQPGVSGGILEWTIESAPAE
jgi:DUF1680 family protein